MFDHSGFRRPDSRCPKSWRRGPKILLFAAAVAAGALAAPAGAAAQDTIRLGITVPMSGAAANWGIGTEWVARQAVQAVNDAGGVKVAGKTYRYDVVAYDNKYNAAEGTKAAQTLLNRDNVQYVVASVGTAPVKALQSLSERKGVLIFVAAWGKSLKGTKFPLTFTQINTPDEVMEPLYTYVKNENPGIKSVAMLNPNDATGQEVEEAARKQWESLGVKVVASDWYERGTTEFQPIAAKMAALKTDAIDLGAAPPGESGVVFKEIKVLGWNGVKVVGAGTSAEAMIKTGGDAVEGVYMGLAADYDGPQATVVQRALNQKARTAIGEPLNVVQMGAYDAVMALKAAMEKADSLEPAKVAQVLPSIVFESSYGPSGFGGKAIYGADQQVLVPAIITQVKAGKLVEVKRVPPAELAERLAAAGKR